MSYRGLVCEECQKELDAGEYEICDLCDGVFCLGHSDPADHDCVEE